MGKIKNVLNKGVAKMKDFAGKVVKGDSHFVAIVVAIVVCIAIAVIFREAIITFVTNIIAEATTQTQNLF